MSKTYEECGQDEYDLLSEILDEYRRDLLACDARITLMFVRSLTEGKPAISHRGQAVAGQCKINSLQDRAEGKSDATILIDHEFWNENSSQIRKGLLHHEITHIGLFDPAEGKRDALDRPKLKSRHGDWENDGFYEIVKIYGDSSPELRYLRGVVREINQQELPFGNQRVEEPVA